MAHLCCAQNYVIHYKSYTTNATGQSYLPVDYQLNINGNFSYFTNKVMKDSIFNYDSALYRDYFKLGKHDFFVNDLKNKKLVNYTSFTDSDMQITDYPEIEWEITDEKLVVSGYDCYKAVGIYEIKLDESLTKKLKKKFAQLQVDQPTKVIAWFTPMINLNLGPSKYHGLPGLIVKVEEASAGYEFVSLKKTTVKPPQIPTFKTSLSYNEHLQKSLRSILR
jgi:GLPGLI family protein